MSVLVPRLLLLLWLQQTATSALPANSAPCVACRAELGAISNGYSADDWQALTRGEIVTSEAEQANSDGSAESHIESSAIIPYPATLVWSVIIDVDARYKFIPGVKSIRIIRTDGNRIWVLYQLRYFLVNVRYEVVNTLHPEQGLMAWTLDKSVEHDIADTTGSWQLVSLPSGQDTLVRYRAWIDTGRPVPRFIADFFVRRSLPKIVGGLRSEVRRRFQR